MGLLDGYLDPEHFEASGGLLGRLLSLQRYGQDSRMSDPQAGVPALMGFARVVDAIDPITGRERRRCTGSVACSDAT